MEGLELNIGPPKGATVPTNTPQETRFDIAEVTIRFIDGTELILPVDDYNGFYRVNDFLSLEGVGFTNHEVFIANRKGS